MKKKEKAGEESFLAADAGNSRVSFGIFSGRCFKGAVSLSLGEIENFPGLIAAEIIALNGGAKAVACMISSVVPSRNKFVQEVCRGACSSEPVFLSGEMDSGVEYAYDTSMLGPDRMAAAAACRSLFPSENVVIIDAGTAVTFGALSRAGKFEGGLIMPGPEASAKALFECAELIVPFDFNPGTSLMAANTTDAVSSGVFLGFVKAVEGIALEMKKAFGGSAKIVASGGWSGALREFSSVVDAREPFLVMKGLRVIFERRRENHHEHP